VENAIVSPAAISEFMKACQTPSICRKSCIAARDVSVGRKFFGQRNTESRPPNAPSAIR
jgi:hypothetical protein